jgi:hypothetical protein
MLLGGGWLRAAVAPIEVPAGEVACMVVVIASEVWLRPKTMVVLGLGWCSLVPRQHGAWWGTVARDASGGSASGGLVGLVCHVGVWPPVVSARCG